MVFHVMIGNTDDHLKNFCMLHGDEGWRLSPAFDLPPDVGRNQEHQLQIGHSFLPPHRAALLNEARSFNISRRRTAEGIIDTVATAVTGIDTVFRRSSVPAPEREHFQNDISRRLQRITRA